MHPGETIVTARVWYLRIGAGIAVLFALLVERVLPSAKGELVRQGDLDYLRVAPGGVERL